MSWSTATQRLLIILILLGSLYIYLSIRQKRNRNRKTWWRTSSHPSFFQQRGTRKNYEDTY